MDKLQILKSEEVHVNPHFSIKCDQFIHPNVQKLQIYYYLSKDPALVIIPVRDDQVYFVRQYRYTVRANSIEFPIGKAFPNEDPLNAAKRELLEETGFEARMWQLLGMLYEVPGFANSSAYIYLASDLTLHQPKREITEEDMDVLPVSFSDVRALILNGTILDSLTTAAWCKYLLHVG